MEGRLPLRGTGSPRWNSAAEQTSACKITPPLSQQGPPHCHGAPLTPAYTPPCLLFSTPQPPAPYTDTPSPSMGLARHTEPPSPIPWALPVPSFPKQDFPIPILDPLTLASWQPSPPRRKHCPPKGREPGLPGRGRGRASKGILLILLGCLCVCSAAHPLPTAPSSISTAHTRRAP